MKKFISIISLAALVLASASCSKSRAEKMAMAENVVATCTPGVLQLVGDKIPATITVTYPEGYFYPEATLAVTPVLVYEGGYQMGTTVVYQGEKVKDNNKVVAKDGGTVTQNVVFDYVKGAEKCFLELRSVATVGVTSVNCPAVKIAEGCNTTSQLVDLKGTYSLADDGYQYILHKSTEGQVLYDVNSAEVKKSELRSQSIKELQAALEEIANDSRLTVTGQQIIAYASPEGGQQYNAKLSDKRAGTAEKAWGKISDSKADVQVKSVGQDWEGFQEAISASDIQDKELILRVLSMYSDPAVRESEIRNMSQIYTEIADKVFPELRRARFVTNYDYKNFTDEELAELADKAVNTLDETALLKVAANTEDPARKAVLYNIAQQKFNSQKALQNLAATYLAKEEPAVAEYYLDKLADQNAPEAVNARGVAAMLRGNLDDAVKLFSKAGTGEAKANLGALDIFKGDYAGAAAKLAGLGTTNEALANILAGNLSKASQILAGLKGAAADYLKAIVAARKGDVAGAKALIKAAGDADAALAARAAKDIEFAAVQ